MTLPLHILHHVTTHLLGHRQRVPNIPILRLHGIRVLQRTFQALIQPRIIGDRALVLLRVSEASRLGRLHDTYPVLVAVHMPVTSIVASDLSAINYLRLLYEIILNTQMRRRKLRRRPAVNLAWIRFPLMRARSQMYCPMPLIHQVILVYVQVKQLRQVRVLDVGAPLPARIILAKGLCRIQVAPGLLVPDHLLGVERLPEVLVLRGVQALSEFADDRVRVAALLVLEGADVQLYRLLVRQLHFLLHHVWAVAAIEVVCVRLDDVLLVEI